MLLNIIIPPRYYFFDSSGTALIGGYIEYSGLIYQDVFKTVPHQNHIRLDENGSALLYFDGECELNLYNRHGDYVKNEIIPTQDEWVFFYNKFGKPLKYGKVFIYRFRSSIEKESFYTADKSVLNTNPVILDGDGKAKIFIDGACRLRVLTADDVLITDEDVYQLPLSKQFKYFLQSVKYPQFKQVHEYWQSNLYPQKVHYKLTSRIYPRWVKQHYVLTSLIFPYIINDDVIFIDNRFTIGQSISSPFDSINIGAKFIDGSISNIVFDYKSPVEDLLKINVIFTSGELKNIAKTYETVGDVLNVGAKFTSGESKITLIRHFITNEDVLNVGAKFINGEVI